MPMVRCAAIGFLICATIGVGCRRHEPASEPVDAPITEPQVPPAGLSDEQKAAVEAIIATGGLVEMDEAGFPTRIDLASERVFADAALVRDALSFPGLKGLRLTLSAVPEELLVELAALTNLEELFLQDATLGDAGLRNIVEAMPELQRLTLRRVNGVTDDSLNAVAACERLEVLALIEMNQVTGAGLDFLAACSKLRSLDLRNCGRLTPGDLGRLSAMKGLVELKLGGPAINDGIAEVIAGLPDVRSITLEDAEISGDFLVGLAADAARAKRIRTLGFARCYGVTDEALQSLPKFPNLESLSLRNIVVTGEFLATLDETGTGPLPLKTLIVTNAYLDNEAAKHLPEVAPKLVRLDLRGNPGLTEDSRQTFEKLENLKDLKLE